MAPGQSGALRPPRKTVTASSAPELPLPSPIPSASPASSRGREGGVQKPSGSAFDREGAGLTKGLHPWLHRQPSKGTQPPSCSPGKWTGKRENGLEMRGGFHRHTGTKPMKPQRTTDQWAVPPGVSICTLRNPPSNNPPSPWCSPEFHSLHE